MSQLVGMSWHSWGPRAMARVLAPAHMPAMGRGTAVCSLSEAARRARARGKFSIILGQFFFQ